MRFSTCSLDAKPPRGEGGGGGRSVGAFCHLQLEGMGKGEVGQGWNWILVRIQKIFILQSLKSQLQKRCHLSITNARFCFSIPFLGNIIFFAAPFLQQRLCVPAAAAAAAAGMMKLLKVFVAFIISPITGFFHPLRAFLNSKQQLGFKAAPPPHRNPPQQQQRAGGRLSGPPPPTTTHGATSSAAACPSMAAAATRSHSFKIKHCSSKRRA
jgi:hypothetical protein